MLKRLVCKLGSKPCVIHNRYITTSLVLCKRRAEWEIPKFASAKINNSRNYDSDGQVSYTPLEWQKNTKRITNTEELPGFEKKMVSNWSLKERVKAKNHFKAKMPPNCTENHQFSNPPVECQEIIGSVGPTEDLLDIESKYGSDLNLKKRLRVQNQFKTKTTPKCTEKHQVSNVPRECQEISKRTAPMEELNMEEKYAGDWSLKGANRKKRLLQKFKPYPPLGEILFGYHPVLIALQNRRRQFHSIFLKSLKEQSTRQREIVNLAMSGNIPVHFVDVKALNTISETPVHQGVCADVTLLKQLTQSDAPSWDPATNKSGSPTVWLLLEQILDPMNLGAIIRCAYYFGVQRIIVNHNNSCRLTPVVSKASSGVMELIDILSVANVPQFLKEHQEKGFQLLGTSSYSSVHPSRDIKDFTVEKPTILIIGNEGRGLETNLLELCDHVVTVGPTQAVHPSVDSLNVGVATGVILYQILSRHSANGI